MDQRICKTDGCCKLHRAKGLCSSCYNKLIPREKRHLKHEFPCSTCGKPVFKVKAGKRRPVCSERCRYILQFGYAPEDRPRPNRQVVGPVYPVKPTSAPVVIVANSKRGFICVPCGWCGASFIHDLRLTGFVSRYCTDRCGKRAAGARHKLAHGRFGISKRIRAAIYERDGWVCQLCYEEVDPSLHWLDNMAASLDHIECQSWALIPDHSPSNLRLAHRICNSLRGDESHLTA